ncbi:hypothetical protein N7522_001296 [Penicillium canescens]|uniref:uncharacterized protein n=1 Tax=Penicillium canescens TaxID=5083 RepID=UPI0026E0DF0F|nr:uncharacterized protein N7446_008369 [Penicillium canescens]KAJ6019229.1 hypothetical protein N7522_001296 [Penicillium canescens]KAJ6033341.1 hypothetical protein N7444_011112 [Penicillium canescens]KAJ6058786.1 hypothetical protein N7446_008369 [Penicillium canescens]KAJ6170278.1 hypothetical protein N7485_007624 [Penicillium canescens]
MQHVQTLPRGIEPRSPALIGFNDKRKSSPLDQGRLNDRVTARPLGWLMEGPTCKCLKFQHLFDKICTYVAVRITSPVTPSISMGKTAHTNSG